MAINWNTAIQYANLVKIAESVNPTQDPAQLKAAIAAAGYQYQFTIFGDDLATDVDPHIGKVVSFGFLATSASGELVAVIRGTDTIWEWIHDAEFLMVPSVIHGSGGLTEDGFSALYRSLRTASDSNSTRALAAISGLLASGSAKTVTVCGHSLGGALATLLVFDVALNTTCRTPTAYTYASPRVGDHLFAGRYNASVQASFRIANRQDLVPKLPPVFPLPYEHVNTEEELNPKQNQIQATIGCMHHLTTYLWLMGQQAGVNAGSLNPECVWTQPAPGV